MEGPPLASVIIPTRDRLPFLKEAVDSVMAQTLPSIEAVVVDDASADGTRAWLTGQADERLTSVLLEEHAERTVARNRGLEKARGEFVLFLDDDDRLLPSALERLHSALAGEPNAIAALGARVLFNERGDRRRLPHPRRSLTRSAWTDLLAGWMSPPGTVLWRIEVLRAAGGWNEQITVSEDRDLWLRASRRGPIAFVPDVVLEKRTHGGQWQATDIREVQARLTQEYIEGLPPREREVAVRFSRAYRLLNDGRIAYGNLQSRAAVSCYLRAIRITPSVLTSPLLRSSVVGGLMKSVVGFLAGNRSVLLARAMKLRLLRLLRRDVAEWKQRRD